LVRDPFIDQTGGATWAPDNDRFAYLSTNDGNGNRQPCDDVWIASAAGTTPVKITQGSPGADACPDRVRWSPDGTLLLLHMTGGSDNGSDNVYVIRPDGTGLVALTQIPENTPSPSGDGMVLATGAAFSPVWSPDSKYVAYVRYDGNAFGLWVMRADGSGATQVGAPAGLATGIIELAWAPS
jgi:Tol biopolymer transport system component